MTTWNSRIILRNDSDWTLDDTTGIDHSLGRGEVGVLITDGYMEVRVGVAAEGTSFGDCVQLYAGRIGVDSLPLSVVVPDESGLADGTVLRWDPSTSRFVPDAEPIAIASPVSGVLRYTAATDTWNVDSSRVIAESIDGGTFLVDGADTAPPSFTSTPTIGAPTP